ncbi:hypothetical protein [Microcystis aeruginosa]|uniref:Uncharacterized protein n=1 Tax=Microcystis aeruginosa FD4 TaxID=2686288 RepID=A0A857CYA9_MICAE|nr:hypothetical protein [Microcystis aeruginosa]QGZ88376.1 hypothetical protein GQR42_00750 [Microcystis aeruginosa FD4]
MRQKVFPGCGVWGVGCGVWGVGCGVWGVGKWGSGEVGKWGDHFVRVAGGSGAFG